MPTDQRQLRPHEFEVPDSIDDSDAVVELSLKLAKAARKRWPMRRYEEDDE
jgi:hypothetical protein